MSLKASVGPLDRPSMCTPGCNLGAAALFLLERKGSRGIGALLPCASSSAAGISSADRRQNFEREIAIAQVFAKGPVKVTIGVLCGLGYRGYCELRRPLSSQGRPSSMSENPPPARRRPRVLT